MELTKEEKAILDEWEKARVRWWTYTPAQLKKLEKEVAEIYEKEEK